MAPGIVVEVELRGIDAELGTTGLPKTPAFTLTDDAS